MDESSKQNNNFMRKPRRFNKQIVSPSNQINSSDIELISINKINSETKSNIQTRKQRLKEYLTTHTSDKNTSSTHQLLDFPTVHLIDLVSEINNSKPVKVKSQWTRKSQIEFALENLVSLQTKDISSVDKLSQTSKRGSQVFTMAVTPVNDANKKIKAKTTRKSVQVNKDLTDSRNHIVGKLDKPVEIKRKRGRPKKVVTETPITLDSGDENSIDSNSLTGSKSEDSSTPIIVKRGRGRPKKNKIIPNIVQPSQIVSNIVTLKKKRRKKSTFTKVKKHTKKMKNDSIQNENITKVSSDLKLSELDLNLVELLNQNNTNNTASDLCFLKCVTIEGCDEYVKEQTECITSCNEQDMRLEFDKIDWNIIPKRGRSKSINEHIKRKHRRNSLSDNFVLNSLNTSKIKNDYTGLKKSWKSLSYLERGPNIHIERNQQNELEKKFRSELKRSRSFPNCMLLDAVTWRFLLYEQNNNNYDDNYDVLSDYEINLINELSDDGYDRQYRSKSVPIEQYDYKMDKNTLIYRSLDNLNMLCYTNNLPITFQIPSNGVLKNTKNVFEECDSKIRRSKRLNTKMKPIDMLDQNYLLESDESKFDYLLLADQIRQENERQLSQARSDDSELDKKLKKLNFSLITNNLFRPHRRNMSEFSPTECQELRRLKPKITSNGDTYNCHCKYTRKDWIEKKPGCGPECLNRLLNIECGSGCLLMSYCTNKQFQNKQFKRTQIVRTPNKGYGVFALEDIPSGSFVDEYVGEVIDQHEMIKRMKTKLYMNNNYMVQLKHDEIIDATRKGNITRFINHSCEPNCVAEKWNVLGESRMGFFSKDVIKKGDEITFDYSFEIFGDAAQQKCYCGTPNCRGFISKKSRTVDQSSSDESDDNDDNILTIKSDERDEKKKKVTIKKITNKDKKLLQELDRQLTDISKLKNKNRSDLESSTLNLNKLMVHITDSMSRSHILKFIRENDFNCKRLFMNFNGLSIIHSWMVSNNNENLKLEIIRTLSDLPISNRNTITKSNVLNIVAEWANIPLNIKNIIENLDYPILKSKEHGQEVDKLLPDENNMSSLVQAARVLWKKWIVLKMVFKIPKLDRPKEVVISMNNPSTMLSQSKSKPDQYNFGKPAIPSPNSKINHYNIKNSLNYVKHEKSKKTLEHTKANAMDTFSKMISHQNQMDSRDKNKAIIEWNKKRWEYTTIQTNKVNSAITVKKLNNLASNAERSSLYAFNSINKHKEIPTIENTLSSNKIKWNTTTEFAPIIYEVPSSDIPVKSDSTLGYHPIEEIIHTHLRRNLPPSFAELHNESTLKSILNTPPPVLPNQYTSSICKETSWSIMCPENILYDGQHPSIEEQRTFISSIQPTVTNANLTYISGTDFNRPSSSNRTSQSQFNKNIKKKLFKSSEDNRTIQPVKKNNQKTILKHYKDNRIKQQVKENIQKKILKPCEDNRIIQPVKENTQKKIIKPCVVNRSVQLGREEDVQKMLLSQCEKNLNKLIDKGLLNIIKSEKQNYFNQSPIIFTKSFFKQNSLKSYSQPKNAESELLNLLKCLKVVSNNYQEQPSRIIKISNLKSKPKTQKSKKDIFRIEETKQTITASMALKLYNEPLYTTPQKLDIRKLLNKPEIKTKNTFAIKILKGLIKKHSTMPNNFVIKSLPNYKVHTLNPTNEIELHHKLIPTVKNTLRAKIKLDDDNTINVYKQNLIMEYDESRFPKCVKLGSISKNNKVLLGGNESKNETCNTMFKSLKRKLPLPPPIQNIKCQKTLDLSIKNVISKSKNQMNDLSIFEKPIPFDYHDTHVRQRQQPSTSSQKKQILLNTNVNEIKQKRSSSSSQKMPNITLSTTNENTIIRKPFMKCMPFNKKNNLSEIELQQTAKRIANYLSMNYTTDGLPTTLPIRELIDPIVDNFKTSINSRKTTGLRLIDDPIVRDYIQRTQVQPHISKRKCKLPESMMSLPPEVLNLVPDNQREIKYVIDFYHSMATVIVKVLDSYVKKSCKQGRIKNDEDFKYLARKLNSNILHKELQVKRVEDLKISDSVKQKVELYIKTYMLKYGKFYRKKSIDQ